MDTDLLHIAFLLGLLFEIPEEVVTQSVIQEQKPKTGLSFSFFAGNRMQSWSRQHGINPMVNWDLVDIPLRMTW